VGLDNEAVDKVPLIMFGHCLALFLVSWIYYRIVLLAWKRLH